MIGARWRAWQATRRARHGEFAALFARYRGDEWVALDLETTGLDVQRDEILSLAAIPGRGDRIRLRERLDLRLRSDSPHIAEAIRHHRLRPHDLEQGLALDDALRQLLAMLGNRPLLGWFIDFDAAMLDRACRHRFGFALPNRRIDVRDEYRAWYARRQPYADPDLGFERMAEQLGVPVFARHTALGDALSAAAMHCAMVADRS